MAEELREMLGPGGREARDSDHDILRLEGIEVDDPLLAFVEKLVTTNATASDMGVRLLAAEIERSRYLFLWLD